MKLKKLSIFGFKSFADRVTLQFDLPVTAIVGPNGCGKSNIVDAFRWVMGEQSAKSLRGEKMHDVLFGGTDHRKAVGYAEVSLTLTDIQGELPTPFEELTLTRRLHRSGESEYLLNKQPVRLRDIQELLLGSGVGKNAFSIFEQGKLDQIILLPPKERRIIFDEAAGTSRFLYTKKETARKLATVTENYQRIFDVHTEVEKQTKQLKKQALQAKHYKADQERLQELEKHLFLFRWQQLTAESAKLENEKTAIDAQLEEKQEELDRSKQALQAKDKALVEAQDLLRKLEEQFRLKETKLRVQEMEIKQQKERFLDVKRRDSHLKSQLETLKSTQKSKSEELEEVRKTLLTANREKDVLQKSFLEAQTHSISSKSALEKARTQLQQKRADLLKKVQAAGDFQTKIQELQLRLTQSMARRASLKEEKARLTSERGKLQSESEKERLALQDLSEQIETYQTALQKHSQSHAEMREVLSKSQNALQKVKEELTELVAREKALLHLQERHEGFSKGAKALLQEAGKKQSPLFGKIAPFLDEFTPEEGFKALTAAAFQRYADTLIVDSQADFECAALFAKENGLDDFSLIIRDKSVSLGKKKPENTLKAHVHTQGVGELFTASVTVAGKNAFYDSLGVFFQISEKSQKPQSLFRKSELKALAEKIEQQRDVQTRLLEQVEKEKTLLKESEEQKNRNQEAKQKLDMRHLQQNFSLQRLLQDLEKNAQREKSLLQELEKHTHLESDEKQLETLKAEWEHKKSETHQIELEITSFEHALKSDEQSFSKDAQATESAQKLLREKESLWQHLQSQILILEAKAEQSIHHEKQLREELHDQAGLATTALESVNKLEAEAAIFAHELKSAQEKVKGQEKAIIQERKERAEEEKAFLSLQKAFSLIEKQRYALEVIWAEKKSQKHSLEEQIQQKFGLLPTQLSKETLEKEFRVENAEQEIHGLRVSLANSGPINMAAIEEFEQKQIEFNTLGSHLHDLQESKTNLEEAIVRLEQECRKVFKKTFNEIRSHFQKNFAILFKGGAADLTFTESPDILEAGIEIVAKPPGKQMRSISLLSGGEKCLTALALLFSLFEVKPAPFCILDEVDAPLDDRNIERFNEVLRPFIEKTQFIIVTHNKRTMAVADRLVGVSMEEKGISKLISLSFESNAVGVATPNL